MSASLRPMTVSEFIAWENAQPDKHEFDGLHVRAMTGGTEGHAGIQRNILVALTLRLRGTRCRAYGSELKIVVDGSVRYPDAFVVCTRGDRKATVADQPVVVFEVLSPSSTRIDRIDKLREYQATPSIQRYVILDQDVMAAAVFTRQGREWLSRVHNSGEVIDMPEIGISVPVSDFYTDIDMTPEVEPPTA